MRKRVIRLCRRTCLWSFTSLSSYTLHKLCTRLSRRTRLLLIHQNYNPSRLTQPHGRPDPRDLVTGGEGHGGLVRSESEPHFYVLLSGPAA